MVSFIAMWGKKSLVTAIASVNQVKMLYKNSLNTTMLDSVPILNELT
jgi:hypothetical protein